MVLEYVNLTVKRVRKALNDIEDNSIEAGIQKNTASTMEARTAVTNDNEIIDNSWDMALTKKFSWKLIKPVAFALVLFLGGLGVLWFVGLITPKPNYHFDKFSCTCDCFDRKLKAGFFNPEKQYRFIYINWEFYSWLIISLASLYTWALGSMVARTISLLFKWRLRWTIAFALAINSYGQFYNFTAVFNYINDRIYYLVGTQLFFSITQWFISIPLYMLLPIGSSVPLFALTMAQSTAITHLCLALQDQGFKHIFLQWNSTNGPHILRDILFAMSDIVPIVILFWHAGLPSRKQAIFIVCLVTFMWSFYAILRIIFPYNYN